MVYGVCQACSSYGMMLSSIFKCFKVPMDDQNLLKSTSFDLYTGGWTTKLLDLLAVRARDEDQEEMDQNKPTLEQPEGKITLQAIKPTN